jgi:hypothetical protein
VCVYVYDSSSMYVHVQGENIVTFQNASLPKANKKSRVEKRAVYSETLHIILHFLPRGLHLIQPIGLLTLPSLDRFSVLDPSHGLSKTSPGVSAFAIVRGSRVNLPPTASSWLTTEGSGLSDRATLTPHADALDLP